MTAEKGFDGAWNFSDIVDGYLFRRKYYGYTKKEAESLFRRDRRIANGKAANLDRAEAKEKNG